MTHDGYVAGALPNCFAVAVLTEPKVLYVSPDSRPRRLRMRSTSLKKLLGASTVVSMFAASGLPGVRSVLSESSTFTFSVEIVRAL